MLSKSRANEVSLGTSRGKKLEPFRQHIDIEFNQDTDFSDDFNQDISDDFAEGSRISHPVFGEGTVTARRGDIAEIKFDSGAKKSFALSIAPLKVLTKKD